MHTEMYTLWSLTMRTIIFCLKVIYLISELESQYGCSDARCSVCHSDPCCDTARIRTTEREWNRLGTIVFADSEHFQF